MIPKVKFPKAISFIGWTLTPRISRSYDVYFSPKPPKGQENNWIQTIPGKGWNTILRLYGPLEPFYDKTWKPGDPELVE